MRSVKCGRAFKPRSSDVFISTYAKCGTTWTMQIVHQLRSGKGDMDFEEVNVIVERNNTFLIFFPLRSRK